MSNICQPLPKVHTPSHPAKQRHNHARFFPHKLLCLFLFPPDFHERFKNNFSVLFLILCTDHHQLFQAVLETIQILIKLLHPVQYSLFFSLLNFVEFLAFFLCNSAYSPFAKSCESPNCIFVILTVIASIPSQPPWHLGFSSPEAQTSASVCVWIQHTQFAEQRANCSLWENGNLHVAKMSVSETREINLAL